MNFKSRQLQKLARAVQEQLQHALTWTPAPHVNVGSGKPYVTECDGILSLHFDKMSIQSEMSLDDTDELVIGYTRAMMSFLLLKPAPKRIAMIGLGGGSLAKYCYRYLPETDFTVIEIDPDVIALRNEFAIPADDARLHVLLGNGVEWVADAANSTDVLIVDGFDATGLPDALSSQSFYHDCYATLADKGIMAANLWGGYPHYDEYVARISTSFAGRIVIVDADDSVNKIVLGLKNADFPSAATIRHHANLLSETHLLNFQAKANQLIRVLPGRVP